MTLVLVVGPPLSGVTAVVAALGPRLPGVAVVEGVSDVVPDAVIGVLSAVAPARRSDWAPVARAAGVAPVVGVVTKIDAHRGWRDVLAADRRSVSASNGRGPSITWVGVAAAPDLGEPRVDELVDVLRELLAEGPKCAQNTVFHGNATPAAPRTSLPRTRLRLIRLVRERCTSWRTELREAASSLPFGGARLDDVGGACAQAAARSRFARPVGHGGCVDPAVARRGDGRRTVAHRGGGADESGRRTARPGPGSHARRSY